MKTPSRYSFQHNIFPYIATCVYLRSTPLHSFASVLLEKKSLNLVADSSAGTFRLSFLNLASEHQDTAITFGLFVRCGQCGDDQVRHTRGITILATGMDILMISYLCCIQSRHPLRNLIDLVFKDMYIFFIGEQRYRMLVDIYE